MLSRTTGLNCTARGVIVSRPLDHVSIDRAREESRSTLRTQNQDIHFRMKSTSFSARKVCKACSNLTQSIQLKIQTLEGTSSRYEPSSSSSNCPV